MAIYSGFSHKKWWFSIVVLNYQRATPGHGSKNVAAADSRIRTSYSIYFANFDNHILQIGSHVPFICSILFNIHAPKNWLLDMYPKPSCPQRGEESEGYWHLKQVVARPINPTRQRGWRVVTWKGRFFACHPEISIFKLKLKLDESEYIQYDVYIIIYIYISVCVFVCVLKKCISSKFIKSKAQITRFSSCWVSQKAA